jgi:hypothetical protein
LLSTLPAGAIINSATLDLYTWVEAYGGGQSVDVYKLSRTNWLEGIGNPNVDGSSNWTTYDETLAIGMIENGTGTLKTNPTSLRSAYTYSAGSGGGVKILTGGTFTVTLNPGVTGVATSSAWSVTDDPKALISGVNVIEVTGSGGGGIEIYLYPDLAWTTPGGDYVIVDPAFATAIMPAEGNWITWDITAIVKDAQLLSIPVELLIMYQAGADADAYIYGRTYATNPALVPKLTIDYTGGGPPPPYQSPPCIIDFKGILDCIKLVQ